MQLTVMGTLMYGAGHVWAAKPIFILMVNSPVHCQMRRSFMCSNRTVACLVRTSLPLAVVDALQDYVTHYYKVRRLHLIMVDLSRSWKYNTAGAREITDQLWRISHGDDTHRVSPFRPDGPEPPLRCRRFAYGYALDGSEYPSYLLWPQRDGQSYTLLDTSTTDTLPLNHDFFRPLRMEHFYVSDSDQNDPPSSLEADAEQYELMQIAYAAVGKDFTGQEDLIGSEYRKLQKLEMVPERWPLARLSFSLQTCVDHLDRILVGCCWEVQATRTTPSESHLSLHQAAKCLTMKLAVHWPRRLLPFSGRFLHMSPYLLCSN